MTKVGDVYGSARFLNAETVKSEKLMGKVLTVKKSYVENFGTDNPKPKVILSFDEIERELALNSTNAKIMSKAFGEEIEPWVGNRIQLIITAVKFKGDIVDSVQVVVPA